VVIVAFSFLFFPSLQSPFPCGAKFFWWRRNLRIKPLFQGIEILFLRIKALFIETESLFYFCIGTKVSFRGEKSKFWWGESSYLSANAFTEI
jgi:hypothetical protein